MTFTSTLYPAMVGCALLAACGGPPQAPSNPTPPPPPLGPLSLLVPEGAETVLVARPAELMSHPAIREVVGSVVLPELLDSFARRTGVEPHEVEEVVVAEYTDGFILLARGPWPAADVVRAAGLRMSTVEVEQDEPFLRRAGWLGTERRDLVAVRENVVVVGGGATFAFTSALARIRRGEWSDEGGPALGSREAASLHQAHQDAPLSVHRPRPLVLPPGFDTSVLLAQERALVATLRPIDAQALDVTLDLRGTFPDGAEANFRALVTSVASSGLGSALGIAEGLQTLTIQVEPGSAVLRMRIPASTLAVGLRVLFVAEIEELLGSPAVPTSTR